MADPRRNAVGVRNPELERAAPRIGHSTEGKPGTRKGRFGKSQRTRFGGRRG